MPCDCQIERFAFSHNPVNATMRKSKNATDSSDPTDFKKFMESDAFLLLLTLLDESTQAHDREVQAVQVVPEIEHSRKTSAGEQRLVPGS